MAFILNIETATSICSVNLALQGKEIHRLESNIPNAHSSRLAPLIKDLFAQTDYSLSNVDAISISKGPGSYTGLRIGTSLAKGLCYSLDKPLISVDTLKALASTYKTQLNDKDKDVLICPMIDARRMEVYTALYMYDLSIILDTKALILEENSFDSHLSNFIIHFIGNGSDKFKNICSHKNGIFIPNIECSASGMAALSHQLFHNKIFESTAYFEPQYLKEFIAVKSKNKVL